MGSFKIEMTGSLKYLWISLLCFRFVIAQVPNDTVRLVKMLKTETNDSIRMGILNDLTGANRFNHNVGIAYADRILTMGPATNQHVFGYVYVHLATIYKSQGKHKLAEENAKKAIEFGQIHKLKLLEAKGYGTLGNIYSQVGDVANSSVNLEKSVSLFVECKDTSGIMLASMNLGGFYYRENMEEKAMSYFVLALNYALKKNDQYMLAQSYNNIGSACLHFELLDSAFRCYEKAYSISKDKFKDLANAVLGNLGDTRKLQDRYDEAFQHYNAQYKEAKDEGYYQGEANALVGMIEVNVLQKNFDKALPLLIQFRDLSSTTGNFIDLIDAYGLGAEVYAGKGMYKEALLSHKRFKFLKDSVGDVELKEKVFELHEQYQGERKDNEILKKTTELEKEQSVTKQRAAERNVLLIIVAFAVIMIGLVLRGYFQKKKYNEEITIQKNAAEHQRELVEEKNKEILDSISYAKHIQEAILPPREISPDIIKDSFVLFKQKDIVSGDFYWYNVKNNKRIITAADCTGHGVPGALMSMLGMTFLNEIVNHMGITKPSEILSELRDLVKTTLKQRGSEGESKDGMDMALISLDPDTLKLEFCGANNPLWIFRIENGKPDFIEIPPDKRPVGYFRGMGIPFTNKEYQLKKGDRIYLFTDGYADQFGGPKGKKFKYKQFQELLSTILEKPMLEQHKILGESFDNWKGTLDQVDDVCIIGFKV